MNGNSTGERTRTHAHVMVAGKSLRQGRAWPAAFGRVAIAICFMTLVVGCGRPPQLETKENVALVMALRTAISGKRADLLESVAERVEASLREGQISEGVYGSLGSMIDAARAGDWERAQAECVKFQKGQLAPTGD